MKLYSIKKLQNGNIRIAFDFDRVDYCVYDEWLRVLNSAVLSKVSEFVIFDKCMDIKIYQQQLRFYNAIVEAFRANLPQKELPLDILSYN